MIAYPKQRPAAKPSGTASSVASRVTQPAKSVIATIKSLWTLQLELLACDLSEAKRRAIVPVILLSITGALGLAGIVVALIGAGEGLAFVLHGQPWMGLLGVGVISLIAAGLMGWYGVRMFASTFEPMQRSQRELQQNLAAAESAVSRLFGSKD